MLYPGLNIIGGLQPRGSRGPMYSAIPDIPDMLDSPDLGGMLDVDGIAIDTDIDIDIAELVAISIISISMPGALLDTAVFCLFPIPDMAIDELIVAELSSVEELRPKPGPAWSTSSVRH